MSGVLTVLVISLLVGQQLLPATGDNYPSQTDVHSVQDHDDGSSSPAWGEEASPADSTSGEQFSEQISEKPIKYSEGKWDDQTSDVSQEQNRDEELVVCHEKNRVPTSLHSFSVFPNLA